jgi:predicted AlkP superfamily pyrophosphatase or phosphodiesterase
MKKNLLFILFVFNILGQSHAQMLDRPKLVVGIVVDQMRWDYLYRYYDRYSEGGFKRLLSKGFTCENVMINYIPSYTAIGHCSIYTGSVPSIHGIAGNDFIRQSTGQSVYCTEDTGVRAVGIPDCKSGRMSPLNQKVTTITDELKLATNFRSKVVGISLKDRGSILPAGHCADAAFWFDPEYGQWISSTWYMQSLPEWLQKYNSTEPAKQLLSRDWNTLYPIETYVQSTADKNSYEKFYTDENSILFPIKTSELAKNDKIKAQLIAQTPSGNTMTVEMAKLAIENYRLGKDPVTDFLAISFSSPDYIGHMYGINSIKPEDCYLRLDRDLADLIACLDKNVGKDSYLLFLTADHGGGHNAQFLLDNKIEAGVWDYEKMCDSLNTCLLQRMGKNRLVKTLNNYQVNFDYSKIDSEDFHRELIKNCIDFFEKQEAVAYVVETKNVQQSPVPQVIKQKIINGYNRELCGEIQIILKPHYYSYDSWRGATHGSWNPYDTHIPLVFYGKGIKHGKSNKEVYITDIAPTLAALLQIQMPSGSIGNPIF